jgi:hypothetical protein
MNACRLLLISAAVAFYSPAIANTFIVTNTLDSGTGSLRQAITDANANPEPDVITFNIPGTGVHTITPVTLLPLITDSVTIDGYTQPGASENTLSNDDNAVLRIVLDGSHPSGDAAAALILDANDCTVRGLVIGNFGYDAIEVRSDGNVIEGNFIGTNAAGTAAAPNSMNGVVAIDCGIGFNGGSNNTIGGVTPAARNLISGNAGRGIVVGISGNVVQGNFIGTDVHGTAALGNGSTGVEADVSGNTIGGTTAAARNIISANSRGVQFEGSNHVLQGNFIGTDVTGTVALPNLDEGLNVDSNDSVIGGLADVPGTPPGNIISGNIGIGLDVFPGSSGNQIQGNIIGADVTGTLPLGNSLTGVFIRGADNTIGGTDSSARNIIAFNGTDPLVGSEQGSGVTVTSDTATGNSLLGNSIFSNAALGIDLDTTFGGASGVTLNDSADGDTGGNNLQNYPTIMSVAIPDDNTTVTLSGALDSTPSTTFCLEFFSSAQGNTSGFGEGHTFLGFKNVTTDSAGTMTYSATFPLPVANERTFTATATDPDGNTSEFSPAFGTRLLNISTRMQVLIDDKVSIGGFIVTGTGPKKVIVRGIGPSLVAFGVPGVLADPVLELHEGSGAALATNDDWQDTQESEIEATGLAPSDDHESAIVMSLDPGSYTAILAGTNQSTGVGLVEVYDLDQAAGSKLANISTRGFVDVGDNVMIGGIITGPSDTGDATVLLRAIGPSLSSSGVPDPLQDPVLELHDGQGTTLTSNDDWQDTQKDEIEATGLAPSDPAESAILQSLSPGNYTAIVSGKDGTTGIGLVEVYDLN